MQNWCEVKPVIDYLVRGLCAKPYPGHPKGCPNLNKNNKCPPKAPRIEELLDLSKSIFAVYNVFKFGEYVDLMKLKHPDWTKRQLECCLYWQGTARKQLKLIIKNFLKEYPEFLVIGTPEACGVDLTKTMQSVGINLEWPPVNFTYQIVLAGIGFNP